MEPRHTPKQTVRQAIDTASGALIDAGSLLRLSEEEFTSLRRRAMSSRVQRRRTGFPGAAFVCACCKHPVYLSRHYNHEGNRWFVHDGHAPDECVYREGVRYSEEVIRALVYRGQQEGAAIPVELAAPGQRCLSGGHGENEVQFAARIELALSRRDAWHDEDEER